MNLASVLSILEKLLDTAIQNPLVAALAVIIFIPIFMLGAMGMIWMIIRQSDDGLTVPGIVDLLASAMTPIQELTNALHASNNLMMENLARRDHELELQRNQYNLQYEQVQNLSKQMLAGLDNAVTNAAMDRADQLLKIELLLNKQSVVTDGKLDKIIGLLETK